jgi:hypothetical protein
VWDAEMPENAKPQFGNAEIDFHEMPGRGSEMPEPDLFLSTSWDKTAP